MWHSFCSAEKLKNKFCRIFSKSIRHKFYKKYFICLTDFLFCGIILTLIVPVCRNWQTRQTQNLLSAMACGFEPHHRHHIYCRFSLWRTCFLLCQFPLYHLGLFIEIDTIPFQSEGFTSSQTVICCDAYYKFLFQVFGQAMLIRYF